MIESFLKYLRFEKRASPHTVLAYENDIQQFNRYLSETYSETAEKADYGMVRSWVIFLVEGGMEAPSVNRKIASLRSFYKFLLKYHELRKDPMLKIKALKKSKRLPGFVKETEMVNILDHTATNNDFTSIHEKLVLELLYGTGLRLSELVTLREINIDLKNQTLKVLGKRNKERVIPFADSLVTIIKDYRTVRDQQIENKDHGLLLVTEKGEACYPMMIYRIVNKYLSLTSSDKKSPHALRHSYATHLLNRGAEINAVKDLLGHSSLAATQVYTHNSIDKLKKVFQQAHPKA